VNSTRLIFVVLIIVGSIVDAGAQEIDFRFELTPYAAYRMGGSFDERDGEATLDIGDAAAHGLVLNGKVQPNTQWEVLYARQDTNVGTSGFFEDDPAFDLDVDYFHIGGTYLLAGSNIRPFIALTVGVSVFDPAPREFASERFFSASIGGGWQFNANRRIGLRLEARAFTTFVESDSNIFCQGGGGTGGCLFTVGADTLTQWEARAGLVVRF
jgi:hypothetical protein